MCMWRRLKIHTMWCYSVQNRYSVHSTVSNIMMFLIHFQCDRDDQMEQMLVCFFCIYNEHEMHGTNARYKCLAFMWTEHCVGTINTFVLNAEYSITHRRHEMCNNIMCYDLFGTVLYCTVIQSSNGVSDGYCDRPFSLWPIYVLVCVYVLCVYGCGKIVADGASSISSSQTVSIETLSKQFTTKTHSIRIAINIHSVRRQSWSILNARHHRFIAQKTSNSEFFLTWHLNWFFF